VFSETVNLGLRMAVEFRHESCFNESIRSWGEENNIMIVSIDAPIATWIVSVKDMVYLRVHGREVWYGYEYSENELKQLASEIKKLSPRRVHVFFNNNHWMLENARLMKKLLEEK